MLRPSPIVVAGLSRSAQSITKRERRELCKSGTWRPNEGLVSLLRSYAYEVTQTSEVSACITTPKRVVE